MTIKTLFKLLPVSAISMLAANVTAQDIDPKLVNQPTQADVGGVGLLQMPTARMAREGEFTASYYDNDEYRRMALSLQVYPWLEATIRYNDVRNRFFSPVESFSGDQTYKDRGIDVKFRLMEESRWLPELSLGLKDLAGTGRFAGEFVAASKRFGPLDFTLGVGFGYLGERGNIDNPFCEAATRFCERDKTFEEGGDFRTDNWFAGSAAIFGGIEYQTPWDPLVLKAEFDGNDYRDDFSAEPIKQDSPWNYGAHYRVNDNFNVQISYERGNTWMFGFNLRTNFDDISQVKTTPPIPAPVAPSVTDISQLDQQQLADDLYQIAGFGVEQIKVSQDGRVVTIIGYQSVYRNHQMAIDRASALLANRLPASVTEYRFVDQVHDMEVSQVTVDANAFKRAHYRADMSTRYQDAYQLVDVNEFDSFDNVFARERNWGEPIFGVRPFLEQAFGGPENFYMYQLRLDGYLAWAPTSNFRVDGIVSADILSNYDDFNFLQERNTTDVPRVRTYVREYATQSDLWLTSLQGTYVKQLSKDWYGSVYGGYLERMFGGVGTEILYRPHNQGWGLGVDINYARQRSYESHFGFRKYDVITGHITGYYEPEIWDDTLVKVSVGRFLAKDNGAQFRFEKKFDSGIVVGAYAALTNLSSEEYGEGSFTKGFYVSIPFDLFQTQHSAGRGSIGWTPITRDGGQMLLRANPLYGMTEQRSRFYSDWGEE